MFTQIDLPQDLRETVLEAYHCRPAFYDAAAQMAYEGELPDYPICRLRPLDRLTVLCRCMEDIQARYEALGVPEAIIRATLSDIPRRAEAYRRKTGKTGLSKEDVIWFRHLHLREIFQLGSLQFQPFSMIYLDREGCGEDYMTFTQAQKAQLPPGSPVVNVHIPAGADLDPRAVTASLREAAAFFPKYFPDRGDGHFLCYSWLLYPGMGAILPETSRIRQFASRFQIIGVAADPAEALKAIYGRRFPRKGDYPQHTALQRAALGHFSSLGTACGVLPWSTIE